MFTTPLNNIIHYKPLPIKLKKHLITFVYDEYKILILPGPCVVIVLNMTSKIVCAKSFSFLDFVP